MIKTTSSIAEIAKTMQANHIYFVGAPGHVQLWMVGRKCLSRKLRETPTDTGDFLDDCVAGY